MSKLTNYFLNLEPDHQGRYFHDQLTWTDEQLEQTHDYIQWWFPNQIPSPICRAAPMLTDEDISAFKTNPVLKDAARFAFWRMLEFYQIKLAWDPTTPQDQRDLGICAKLNRQWLTPANHNFLRLTRILKFLRATDLWPPTVFQANQPESYSSRLLTALMGIARQNPDIITEKVIGFWKAE